MTNKYTKAVDIIGTSADRAIIIRVKNMRDVVKREGGALGDLAQTVLPDFTSEQFYSKLRSELSGKFKEKGVDAQVDVVLARDAPTTPAQTGLAREFAVGIGIGLAIEALGLWLWRHR